MNRAKIKPTKLSKLSKRQKLSFLVFPVVIIYMELIFKFLTTPDFLNQGLIFMPLFSIVAGTVLSVICSCFTSKTGNILARIFLFILAFIFFHYFLQKSIIFKKIHTISTIISQFMDNINQKKVGNN